MRVSRHSLSAVWPLAVICMGYLPGILIADEVQHALWEPIDIEELSSEAASPAFGLQFSVQPGEVLLIPAGHHASAPDFLENDSVIHANHWESEESEPSGAAPPSKRSTDGSDIGLPAGDSASGLFATADDTGASRWSSTLDSAAESRVDAAVRAAGVSIVVLSLVLVGFLGWHRLRNTQLTAPTESSELTERGRLPITQTCRLHLVRAGACNVLVAVDRGSVKAMTPLPADFSQLAAVPFDAADDEMANNGQLT